MDSDEIMKMTNGEFAEILKIDVIRAAQLLENIAKITNGNTFQYKNIVISIVEAFK